MRILLLLSLFGLFNCSVKKAQKSNAPAQKAIDSAIKAHGGKAYETANYSFVFRSGTYTFKHNGGAYEYTYDQTKNNRHIYSELTNDNFVRIINDEIQNLSDADKLRYSNRLNSVIYFALLPFRLNDPAVKKADMGTISIKGQNYHAIKVSFNEEKGGTDHDDVFYYWINQKTNIIDYMAYEFHVNGGGVRFRSAFNSRMVDGIRFQDYENYSADPGTPLQDLPGLYEAGSLKLLSKIELEQVKKLN